MKKHDNTLYVTTQGAYLAVEGANVLVRVEKETRLRVPLHNLGGIVCFGNVGCSPFLMGACGKAGVAIAFHALNGRFLAGYSVRSRAMSSSAAHSTPRPPIRRPRPVSPATSFPPRSPTPERCCSAGPATTARRSSASLIEASV